MCHDSKAALAKRGQVNALTYLEWGEEIGYGSRPSTTGRSKWWDIGTRSAPPIVAPCSFYEFYRLFDNPDGILVDKRLYEIHCSNARRTAILAAANTSLYSFLMELSSRTGLGEGLVDLTVYEVASCLLPDPNCLPSGLRIRNRPIGSLWDELGIGKAAAVNSLSVTKERKDLDQVVFAAIGLSPHEQADFYCSWIGLVESRLHKADSV